MPQKNFIKKIVFLLAVCHLSFFVSGCGRSFHFTRQQPLTRQEKQPSMSIAARKDLRIGEKLTYQIRWMGIPVGTAVFNVKEIARIGDRDCYHIAVYVRSNAFLSKIYRVDDEFHTYMDKEKLHSLRFVKRQAEGRYRSHEAVDYDQQNRKAVYKSLLNNSVKEFGITENAQDDLSAIYYFRMLDVRITEPVLMNVNADEKNWILEINVLQAGFLNISGIGNLNAIEVEPRAKRTDGKPLKKGRAWIWFSADENRIPLAAKAKAAIAGTVTAILTQVE